MLANDLALPQCVKLQGEYDLSRKDELAILFGTLLDRRAVEVDMSRVTYIDSTFLHALTALHYRFKEFGVTLLNPQKQIRRILRMMDFEELFTITGRHSDAP